MGGDPIPGPHEILRDWYSLPEMKGRERAEAISRLEAWLMKWEHTRTKTQQRIP